MRITAANAPITRPDDPFTLMAKVLIIHPSFERLGGIETFFLKVCPHLAASHLFSAIAQRPGESGASGRLARIVSDYRRCWRMLADRSIGIVHINPSLEPKSFFREAIFLLMAKLRGKKALVFFHGWRPGFQARLERQRGLLFRLLYGRADAFVVLANAFADTLRRWGVTRPIHAATTVIADEALADFDVQAAIETRLRTPAWRVVIASRLMATKGIGTTLAAMQIVQQSRPDFELVVAGSGEYAVAARALAERLDVRGVTFTGAISNDAVCALLRGAHLLCFPTEHDEGFPNVIVEAMAFGVPVITRPVGGIPDFFQSGVHGWLTASTAPEDFARLILSVAEDPDRYRAMALANHAYARRHFLASQAAARLDAIYDSL